METTHARVSRGTRRVALRTGGAEGNARLTAATAALLVVLLAVEGATIPWIGPLLGVHVFVGMLLLGPLALKLASTGYRFLRYYTRRSEYAAKGPPAPLMRLLVAPVLVASTVTLFGSGIAAVALGQRGLLLGLHKASFIVWAGAFGLHLLVYARRALAAVSAELGRRRFGGAALRVALLLGALTVGAAVAALTLPLAASWAHVAGTGWER